MLAGIIIVVILLLIVVFVYSFKNANNEQKTGSTNTDADDNWWTSEMEEDYRKFQEQQNRDIKNMPLTDANEKLTPSNDTQLCSKEKLAVYVAEIESLIASNENVEDSNSRKSIKVFDSDYSNLGDIDPTFQEQLLKLIGDKGLTNVEFYNAAWIDRKLFSAINGNKYYKPKKETAVACCFGLKLSLWEAEKLLKAAGYALSDSILWDRIIKYCLQHDINRIEQVNQILDEMDEKCIGC
ncbi:hypothetical protein SAMN02910413_1230 [Pseudobutyrivibrio sp. C4]|uniref:hypothetical protein n=1 Tax=Pseudobutyrivibrio sp. C4 TaxID=1520803 RepID=UPI0008D8D1B1|nr:hypothetical protein [Pseudobutyrivibrio sp. C4]SES91385.1 hypothetical protein SAMN02910413_1230 [Pseudobutyrivibrio sp. C4]